MGEGLCGTSMFGSDRWGVNPMTAGKSSINIFLNLWYYFTVVTYNYKSLPSLIEFKAIFNKFLSSADFSTDDLYISVRL